LVRAYQAQVFAYYPDNAPLDAEVVAAARLAANKWTALASELEAKHAPEPPPAAPTQPEPSAAPITPEPSVEGTSTQH
jgi:hypothetical protein